MEYKNKTLELNKQELINIIENNLDKKSIEVDNKLIKTIHTYYYRLSVKQYNWITAKINFIIKNNKKYKEYRDFKDISLL